MYTHDNIRILSNGRYTLFNLTNIFQIFVTYIILKLACALRAKAAEFNVPVVFILWPCLVPHC